MRGSLKLALVVVLALFVSVLQCAASCTVTYSASDNLPPCHKHHSAPVCHELVLSAAQQVSTVTPVAILSQPAMHTPQPVQTAVPAASIFSPPGLTQPPSSVLRI
jgi:hypothetical protein